MEHFALCRLGVEQPLIIMVQDITENGVVGFECLDYHFALPSFASRTSRHLLQHLVRPLVTAEIGLVEQLIGIENRHQRHIVEMQSFTNHLRADQYVHFVARKGVDNILISRFVACGIQIHTQDLCFGE